VQTVRNDKSSSGRKLARSSTARAVLLATVNLSHLRPVKKLHRKKTSSGCRKALMQPPWLCMHATFCNACSCASMRGTRPSLMHETFGHNQSRRWPCRPLQTPALQCRFPTTVYISASYTPCDSLDHLPHSSVCFSIKSINDSSCCNIVVLIFFLC
jgi:hypothetical protein